MGVTTSARCDQTTVHNQILIHDLNSVGPRTTVEIAVADKNTLSYHVAPRRSQPESMANDAL
jgi:hypothetical protein